MKTRRAHCSWCLHRTEHRLEKARRIGRDEYRCARCEGRTLRCRLCDDMARGPLDYVPDGRLARVRGGWSDELCAVHDGSIGSFDLLRARLDDLADYAELFPRRRHNLRQLALVAAGGAGGAVLLAPLALVAAPGVAASLGAAGVLGAAGTGTAISTLSGAALTSASLAALGGGWGMAGGAAVIGAAGAALGAHHGALVSQAYIGQIEGFAIRKLQAGRGPAVVVIDGFLTERVCDGRDWMDGLAKRFPKQPWYHVAWESKRLRELATMVVEATGKAALGRLVTRLRAAPRWKPPALLSAVALTAGLARNPWHTAVVRSSMTGAVLADLLVRTKHAEGFVLLGHSLGARVVLSTLQGLATRERRIVREAYLLGGAAARADAESWRSASRAVRHRVVNAWSSNDAVLSHIFPVAMGFRERAIGAGPIAYDVPSVVDLDVSDLVSGHAGYKPALGAVLQRAAPPDAWGA